MSQLDPRLSQAIISLQGIVPPKVVGFAFLYIQRYMAECDIKGVTPSTVGMVEDFPKSVVKNYGLLSDVFLNFINLTSYKDIGLVLDTLIANEHLTYSPGESLSDFDNNNLQQDISNQIKDYKTEVEQTLVSIQEEVYKDREIWKS